MWRYRTPSRTPPAKVIGPPALVRDHLIIGMQRASTTGEILALNQATGHPAWTHEVDQPVLDLCRHDDRVLFITSGAVSALDALRGSLSWATPARDPEYVVSTGSMAILTSHRRDANEPGQRLSVLRGDDGREIWAEDLPRSAGLETLVAGESLLAASLELAPDGTDQTELANFRLSDGTKTWRRTIPSTATWIHASRSVVVIADLTRAQGLDPATGQTIWTLPQRMEGRPGCWLVDDVLVVSCTHRNAQLQFDTLGVIPQTGEVVWKRPLTDWLDRGVSAADMLYATTSNRVIAINSAGIQLWTANVPPDATLTLGRIPAWPRLCLD
ncbi:PQQ-binding-like beta-propeller repeat protein [Acrocarpospora corrugata]|uniref:outer membrane protein assembly factor BamB family protein n=1 Tax=Acrocarpospora corrugata TaxID=35763 RepID=UPI0024839FCB